MKSVQRALLFFSQMNILSEKGFLKQETNTISERGMSHIVRGNRDIISDSNISDIGNNLIQDLYNNI